HDTAVHMAWVLAIPPRGTEFESVSIFKCELASSARPVGGTRVRASRYLDGNSDQK
ncbi:hypothetical protein Trydic_g10584, partial [Trypoxylus dichotomus]